MPVANSSLSIASSTAAVLVEKGQSFMFNVGGTFVGTWNLDFKAVGDEFRQIGKSYTVGKAKSGKSPLRGEYRITASAMTSGTIVATIFS